MKKLYNVILVYCKIDLLSIYLSKIMTMYLLLQWLKIVLKKVTNQAMTSHVKKSSRSRICMNYEVSYFTVFLLVVPENVP